MAVVPQSGNTILTNAVTAVQGAASALIDFSVGSISRAYMQACMGIALWLEALVMQVANSTRLSTASGTDVDTWLQDYNTARQGATFANGQVTFGRNTNTIQAQIPAGSVVETNDGADVFFVIGDTTQSAWSATLNAYVIPSGTSTCTATIQAETPGAAGNVAAGLVNTLAQSIVGVDYVINNANIVGGADAQSDTQAKAAFPIYLASLTQGTKQACINAVLALQAGMSCYITENYNYSGGSQPGYFYAIVDDGTGSPSTNLLNAAYAAIDRVRAIGTIFGVFAPNVLSIPVLMTINDAAGYSGSTVSAPIVTAITNYIDSLTLGESLYYTKLIQIAFDASPGVLSVTGYTLNGGTSDITATGKQLIRAGSVTVNA